MKLHKIVAGIFTLMSALWLTASDARAQQYVECRSQNYQYRECPVPWGRSELVRRLSDRQCVEHQTWGQGRGFVWVHQGCAANFGEARGGGNGDWQPGQGEIACNSDRNRYRECRTNWRNARLVRQTSNAQCVEDQTWGFRRGLLWVDRGCAGIFSEGWGGGWGGSGSGSGGQQIECNSDRNRYRECRTGDWRAAQLIRQTSNAQCIEGRTWGYGRGMLWVDQGCAGVFAPAQNWGGGWDGGGRKLTCNSQNNRYHECAASGWRNARLLRQTSRASCIEGRTWGLRNGRIWVDQGCAGDFGETR